MSTPNPRRPAHGASQTPATPPSTSSFPVEPRSEYLRHALDAKRAKQATPAPSPLETTLPQPLSISRAPSDPWLDQAKSEDDVPHTPIRRSRRPSDGAVPRMRTQRELQADSDKMKEMLFNLNMKLELVRKQNNDLKDQMEEAQKRIEELESAEEENHELREQNQSLTLKLQNVTEEAIELRDRNAEILQIQDESVANMEKQFTALEEAAEIIIRLEGEKAVLSQENTRLNDEATNLRMLPATQYHAQIDGATKDRYPARVYSIDESRPSTSHFDSDYYSQPASPQVKSSKESFASVSFSERAKHFLSMNKDGKRSIQDLKKRVSDASLKNVKRKSSVPEVPSIPEAYQAHQTPITTSRTPRRSRAMHSLSPIVSAPPISGGNTVPITPTGQMEGLRAMFREGLTLDTSNIRPSSSYSKSPLATKGFKSPREVDRPAPPARQSSRHAKTSSSNEHLTADQKSDREIDTQTENSEWAELPPPSSIISEDLTVELDTDRRDRWWKSIDRLQHSTGKARVFDPSSGTGGARALTARGGSFSSPYMEKDFFFNGAEDEDQFMRRAQGYMPKRDR